MGNFTKEMERTVFMEEQIKEYYANNAQKLRRIVDRILLKFGGLSEKDQDDFYSLANEVFVDVLGRYDSVQSFDTFLYSCLSNKIKTEITRRNRYKRKADHMTVSIDTPIGDEEDCTLGDMIADSFDMNQIIFGEENSKSIKIERYLERLSKLQREVVKLLADSYGAGEIQKKLQISQREYSDAMRGIHSYENTSLLF